MTALLELVRELVKDRRNAQDFIKALPLTALNDALRAVMNEGASLGSVGTELAICAAWGLGCFALALRLFKWR